MKWVSLAFVSIGLLSAEAAEEKAYLRFQEKEGEGALEVGIISLEHKETGAKVDLVGAVSLCSREIIPTSSAPSPSLSWKRKYAFSSAASADKSPILTNAKDTHFMGKIYSAFEL
jgi:hypothetical protein